MHCRKSLKANRKMNEFCFYSLEPYTYVRFASYDNELYWVALVVAGSHLPISSNNVISLPEGLKKQNFGRQSENCCILDILERYDYTFSFYP